MKGETVARDKLVVGINRYTRLYTKYIKNKDLPYSTGSYSQYLVKTFNGRDSEKKYIYLVITYIYAYTQFNIFVYIQLYISVCMYTQMNHFAEHLKL